MGPLFVVEIQIKNVVSTKDDLIMRFILLASQLSLSSKMITIFDLSLTYHGGKCQLSQHNRPLTIYVK